MRDYFADIVFNKVTGVTQGDISIKSSKTAIVNGVIRVTPNHNREVTCSDKNKVSPLVTIKKNHVVTLQARKTVLSPLSPRVTHQNWTYEQEERAAILEYGGG